MKALHLALVLLGVISTVANGFQCPDPWGYFADPDNCAKYFICEAEVPIPQDCPVQSGQQLLYDAVAVACDFPYRVDCGDRPLPGQQEETTTTRKTTAAAAETTTKLKTTAAPTTAPAPTETEPAAPSTTTTAAAAETTAEIITTAAAAETTAEIITITTSAAAVTTTPSVEPDFKCPALFGSFPDPENCIKGYACLFGIAHRFQCEVAFGHQLLFDGQFRFCRLPAFADCGDRPICDQNDQNCDGGAATTAAAPTTKPVTTTAAPQPTTTPAPQPTTTPAPQPTTTAAPQPTTTPAPQPTTTAAPQPTTTPAPQPTTTPAAPLPSCATALCPSADATVSLGPCHECFCQCSNFEPIEICCAPGLVYLPATGRCEYAAQVAGCAA